MATKEIGFPFWQASYYDHIIRNDSDYMDKYDEIDDNPENWQDDEYFIE